MTKPREGPKVMQGHQCYLPHSVTPTQATHTNTNDQVHLQERENRAHILNSLWQEKGAS